MSQDSSEPYFWVISPSGNDLCLCRREDGRIIEYGRLDVVRAAKIFDRYTAVKMLVLAHTGLGDDQASDLAIEGTKAYDRFVRERLHALGLQGKL